MFTLWNIIIYSIIATNIVSLLIIFFILKPAFAVQTAGNANQTFDNSILISDDLKDKLEVHYVTIIPILKIWQKRAWIYGSLYYYVVIWTSLIALSTPFLVPLSKEVEGNYFLQGLSAYSAIILGLYSIFKIQDKYKKYRLYESAVYSCVRKMKFSSSEFGSDEGKRFQQYIKEIEDIRDKARNEEIDNIPAPASERSVSNAS